MKARFVRAIGAARRVLATAVVLGVMATGGCAGDRATVEAQQTIQEDVFRATYVDLRVAALSRIDGELDEEERNAILDRHDVSPEDLVDFVTIHGRDVGYMRNVWDRIESELRTRRDQVNDSLVHERADRSGT